MLAASEGTTMSENVFADMGLANPDGGRSRLTMCFTCGRSCFFEKLWRDVIWKRDPPVAPLTFARGIA